MSGTVVWFQNDLRLADHDALRFAAARGGSVVPLYVWSPDETGASGAASRWWLRRSLRALDAALRARGLRLLLRRGPVAAALRDVARATGADVVAWSARSDAPALASDESLSRALAADGIEAAVFPGALLHDPDATRTGSGGAYRVFTAFRKRVEQDVRVPDPQPAPALGPHHAPNIWPDTLSLDALDPAAEEGGGWADAWTPGEAGASARLSAFVEGPLAEYHLLRDLPAEAGTSMLSPHLHFGEISPRQVWAILRTAGPAAAATTAFRHELLWREFAYHLLHHFPHTAEQPLVPAFHHFPWEPDEALFDAWRRGMTGYPIVDAGMRQLVRTGWMHNRVRMVVASFLTKDLLVPWQDGARLFQERLVDADLACNTLGWQWTAGCGADAQPFFRIFNPTTQGRRFDPDGTYVRRWVPELAGLPAAWIHRPHEAPVAVLASAGVRLGRDYPAPVVDHAAARRRALDAFAHLRQTV